MRELALFAGAGGGLLGSRLLGWKTVCYVEWEPFCIELIKARIKDGCLEDAPIWDDVRSFDGRPWRGRVDVISAGFPCQPFSNSGKRKAGEDARNMWPETIRIIKEVGPAFALLENVPGLRAKSHGYFGQVLRDLAACGYDARWDCIPASALGAPHQRDRLWVVAYPCGAFVDGILGDHAKLRNMGNNRAPGQPVDWNGIQFDRADEAYRKGLLPPGLARMDDGLAGRLDRLKAVGNGQVPQVVKFIWEAMTVEAEMVRKLVTKVA
jgi:DNA (cytosine-5)-methyltransferase 1